MRDPVATRNPFGLHETSNDIENEVRIINTIAKAWGLSTVKFLLVAYCADAMAFAPDGSYCFLEARKRSNASTKYPTLAVSLQKWIGLVGLSWFAKTYYVVEWDDGIGYHEVTQEVFPIHFMSRNTGDPRDNEPVVNIPISRFRFINGRNEAPTAPLAAGRLDWSVMPLDL